MRRQITQSGFRYFLLIGTLPTVLSAWIFISCPPCFAADDTPAKPSGNTILKPAETRSGYIALLLINETPFPGEKGWVSENNTKDAMLSILWVLHRRTNKIPQGYTQKQIATVKTQDILDVITAGGEKGQCDGFYRNKEKKIAAVPRVHERLNYLEKIANKGKPGRFARLINHAQTLVDTYLEEGILAADIFGNLHNIDGVRVTGGAYSWMTDRDYYHPGGNYIRIPKNKRGSLGGNQFFTLRKLK